ncbi:MAG: hypothetical protein LBV52_03155 [Spirochaetaceae bacterium]|jgi:hypothetical protein|nr:hypothetical protein [Spirochaetaceae bacterium]
MKPGFKRIYLLLLSVLTAVPAFSIDTGYGRIGKYSDIGGKWSAFSKDNSARLPVTGDLGLNWTENYVGPLIHFPPHFGFGITIGANTMDKHSLAGLTTLLGKEIEPIVPIPTFAENSQFYPNYLLEARIGGFRDYPFDIGFKVGYLPNVLPFGDYKYGNLTVGADFRYAVVKDRGSVPGVTVSFGVDYNNGSFEQTGYSGSWSDDPDDLTLVNNNTISSEGSDLRITWDSLSFFLKAQISKGFFNRSVGAFAGAQVGYSITNSGLSLVGDDFTYDDGTGPIKVFDSNSATKDATLAALESMGNGSSWKIKADFFDKNGAWGTMSGSAISFVPYAGVGFNFLNNTTFQITGMFDLINMEYGFSVGYRWVQ